MPHVLIEIPVMAAAAAMMASMVLAVGAAIEPAPAPVLAPVSTLDMGSADTRRCRSAPVTQRSGAVAVGSGTICDDDQALSVAVRVTGLAPGETYTAWLRQMHRPAPCEDAPCPPASLLGESQAGSLALLGEAAVPPSGILSLHQERRDVRLTSGVEVAVLLAGPGGPSGPAAQVVFVPPTHP